MGSIIRCEQNQCIFSYVQFLEEVENASGIAIYVTNHGRESFFWFRPIFVGKFPEVGYFHAFVARLVVGMRNIHGEVQEEWTLMIFTYKPECIVCKEVRCELGFLHRHASTGLW